MQFNDTSPKDPSGTYGFATSHVFLCGTFERIIPLSHST